MKNYYEVLGVREDASEREIKHAHHQLALQLHPDRTPDPAARTRFLDVQEAYDVLGDYHRRLVYDLFRQRARELAAAPPPHGPSVYDPPTASVAQARARGRRQRDEEAAQLHRYVPMARRINWVLLLFCVSLALDWALPLRVYPTEEVLNKTVVFVSVSRANPRIAYLITTPQTQFKLRDDFGGRLHLQDRLTVWRTPLWRVVRRIQPRGHAIFQPYSGGVYGALAFWPALLLAVAAAGLLPGRSEEFQVNSGIVAMLLSIIVGFVLYQSL